MVQGWYQGGISVFDWTDAANPKEKRSALFRAETASGEQRRGLLTALSAELNGDAATAADGTKVRKRATAVSQLAYGQSAARCAPGVS